MRKITAILLALLICVMPVSAQLQTFEVESKSIENYTEFKVSGKLDGVQKETSVSFEIIDEGYSFSGIPFAEIGTAVVFADQQIIGEGETEFNFDAMVDGETRMLKGKLYSDGIAKDFDLKYVKNSEFAASATAVNNALTTVDSLVATIETTEVGHTKNNAFILSFDDIIDPDVSVLDAAKYLYTELKNVLLSTTDKDAAAALWRQVSFVALTAEKEVQDISEFSQYIDFKNANTKKWYEKIVSNPSAAVMLTELVNSKEYNKKSDFDKAFEEYIILTVIAYPNGNDNVGKVLSDYSAITNITATNQTYAYTQMAGKRYGSLSDALTTYAGLIQSGGKPAGGGGGGGAAGNRVSESTLVNIQSPETNAQQAMSEVNMKFIDLDSVPWAYTAISTLTEMGIISGKSETRFMPEATITREEFAKLCVAAMGGKKADKNVFIDAVSSEWYTGYINAAYEMGICMGVSDGVFGVGQNVSRQDIAVMLYRMIADKTSINNELEFVDSDSISDYAKTAVAVLSGMGIINGVGDNRFAPNANATRAEAAKMLFGIVNILNTNE